ncbi:hypothetical protein H2198_003331 [Neophaeococcomyces mojaviensis]|uniref:Uncharacterized protein n=1 Tax=Neophaeococcomyces mojaviensis TaxID=3383035 RepID=A0ACC3ABK9_9EURO|nr:hypothetical protein H2198_003331 [Knufia sp. JES_112]
MDSAKSNGSLAGLSAEQEDLLSTAWDDGSEIFNAKEIATTTNWSDTDSLYQLKVDWFRSGYGFNSSGITVRLSITVLVIYDVLVVSYLIWTFVTGRTSSSWDSVGELLMLALNSKRATFLGRTSAGVESLSTYRQEVNVKVNELDESLELVFINDPDFDKTMYKDVEVNKVY